MKGDTARRPRAVELGHALDRVPPLEEGGAEHAARRAHERLLDRVVDVRDHAHARRWDHHDVRRIDAAVRTRCRRDGRELDAAGQPADRRHVAPVKELARGHHRAHGEVPRHVRPARPELLAVCGRQLKRELHVAPAAQQEDAHALAQAHAALLVVLRHGLDAELCVRLVARPVHRRPDRALQRLAGEPPARRINPRVAHPPAHAHEPLAVVKLLRIAWEQAHVHVRRHVDVLRPRAVVRSAHGHALTRARGHGRSCVPRGGAAPARVRRGGERTKDEECDENEHQRPRPCA